MKSFLWIILLLCCNAVASPTADLKMYGEGKMSFLFWDLYHAQLYGANDSYQTKQLPMVLKLTYLKDIDKSDLIKATQEQWQVIGLKHQNMAKWIEEVNVIWPDIKKGDQLIIRVNRDFTSSFYDGNNKLGQIQDPDFGLAFLAIWLSPKTSEPQLRSQLIEGGM